jgi:hypothetical protein
VDQTVACTRGGEEYEIPFAYQPQAQTMYADIIDYAAINHPVSDPVVLKIGADSFVVPQTHLFANGGSWQYQHNDSTTSRNANSSFGGADGDRAELRAVLAEHGAVTVGISNNAAAEITNGPTAVLPLAPAWSAALLHVGSSGSGSEHLFGAYRRFAIVGGVKTLDDMRALFAGGTTYSDTVTETATAADTETAAADFVGALAESGTAAETQTGLADFVVSRAESGTTTDAQSGAATWPASRDEAVTAAETQAGTADFAGARAETLTAAETASGPATFAGVRAESGTAAETETATAVFVGARAESGSAAESETATADFSAARAEVGSAAESETATAVFAGARAEALSATATDAASADFASARAESLTAAETTDATVSGGAVYDVTVDEAGAASDVQSSTADFTGLATEALAALEFESAAATFAGSVPETLAAADEQTGELAGLPTTYDVSVAESLSVVDSSDALEPAMGGGGGGFSQPYPKRPGFHITVTPPPAIWDWVVPRVRVVVGARRVVTAPARREWVVPAAVVALGTVRPFLAPARAEWVALTPEVSSAPDRAEELLILSLAVGL